MLDTLTELTMKNYKVMTLKELNSEFADINLELRNVVVAEVMGRNVSK